MGKQTARPTPVDEKTYTNFVHKCRINGFEISEKLTGLMKLYIKKGEKLFEN